MGHSQSCDPALALGRCPCARGGGGPRRGDRLATAEVDVARSWGAGRALGIALRAAGLVDGSGDGTQLLAEAVAVLRPAPAPLELARALVDLGSAQRRSGARNAARRAPARRARPCPPPGRPAAGERARRELVIAGGKPRRDAVRGRDALTPSELRVAELAASGQTNRQIAQALFITQRTVENHLTSTYGKLGIGSRRARRRPDGQPTRRPARRGSGSAISLTAHLAIRAPWSPGSRCWRSCACPAPSPPWAS